MPLDSRVPGLHMRHSMVKVTKVNYNSVRPVQHTLIVPGRNETCSDLSFLPYNDMKLRPTYSSPATFRGPNNNVLLASPGHMLLSVSRIPALVVHVFC